MSDCCLNGIQWGALPKDQDAVLTDIPCYMTGSNPNVAILILHDIYGWTFRNTRLLADHYAEEVNADIYVPDLFGGEVLPLDILLNKDQWHKLDLPAFQERQDKPIREPEILRMSRSLRSKYQRLGVIGFCYGAWGAFRLGDRNQKLVDCVSVAHPSRLEREEIESVGVPVQILAPEFNPAFTEDMKTFSWQKIPALGVALDYQHFPGVEHGFAVRGDPGNPEERKAMGRAKDAAVSWFCQWLHRDTV